MRDEKEGRSRPQGERLDLASCLTLSNLMAAARKCYRGVSWKRQPVLFMSRLLTNCQELRDEVLSGRYAPKDPPRFTVNERGKVRLIKPVDFRDRVVQRCLADHVIVPAIVPAMVEDCSACLEGRGLTYALERVRGHAASCPPDGWVVQYDFHDYFHTIDRDLLLAMLEPLVGNDGLMGLIELSVREEGPGLELGSHVSQLLACFYPTPLDRAVTGAPGVTGYHRYMDDGIVFCEDRQTSVRVSEELGLWADSMGLELNGRKTHANRVSQPFVFCKMRFSKQPDGSVRMNVRKQQSRRSVKHARRVAELAEREPDRGIDLEPVRASLEGYLMRGDADLSHLVDRALDL